MATKILDEDHEGNGMETSSSIITENSEPYFRALDERGRLLLKGMIKSQIHGFMVHPLKDGSIVLKPMVLASPEDVISAETQADIGKAVGLANKGKFGREFSLDDFPGLDLGTDYDKD